jgi:hypothetical protein
MTSGMNFNIVIDGKQGMFKQELRNTWFHEHTCTKGFADDLKEVKKELVKMIKRDRVIITTSQMTRAGYNSQSLTRYCFGQWQHDGTYELEVRPFTGTDFSEIKKLNFTTLSDLFKYLMKTIEKEGLTTLDEIPVDDTWYAMEIR